MQDIRSEHAAVGLIDQLDPARSAETLAFVESARGTGAVENQDIRAIQPEQIGRRDMPKILADQHAQATEAGIEGAYAVALREIARFVEHGVGRQIELVVDLQ